MKKTVSVFMSIIAISLLVLATAFRPESILLFHASCMIVLLTMCVILEYIQYGFCNRVIMDFLLYVAFVTGIIVGVNSNVNIEILINFRIVCFFVVLVVISTMRVLIVDKKQKKR